MSYELAMCESFPIELGQSPRKVQKSYRKTVAQRLRERPDRSDPPTIKKLKGWNLWRYKVGSHRVIYVVDVKKKMVTLLMVGPRSNIYDRLGHVPGKGPATRIIAQPEEMGAYLEEQPTAEMIGQALNAPDSAALPSEPTGIREQLLPRRLDEAFLGSCGVPKKFMAR